MASRHSGNAPVNRRFAAALVISCVLHIALLGAVYLGERARDYPSVATPDKVFLRPFTASLRIARQPEPELPRESRGTVEHREGAGWLPYSAPTYYTTDQLSKRPQPLGSAELDVPEIRPIVASGSVILQLWIDESGAVIEVAIEQTSLPDIFSRTAVAAFKGLRFAPGERSGVRVGSVMRIEVNYDDGRASIP